MAFSNVDYGLNEIQYAPRKSWCSFVQDNAQGGGVDVAPPSYPMKPSLLKLVMKWLTRARDAPIICASVSCDTLGSIFWGSSCIPYRASTRRARASRFSLELKSWSIRSSSVRIFRESI